MKLLNDACSNLYGNEEKGITARNINIEDIKCYMTETAISSVLTSSSFGVKFGNQVSSEYTTYKKYPVIYAQEKSAVIDGITPKGANLDFSDQNTFIERSEGTSTKSDIGAITTATSIQPYNTYWSKNATFMSTAFKDYTKQDNTTDNYYNLIMPSGNSATYWIASRCGETGPNEGFAFCVLAVVRGQIIRREHVR